jgi:hypothetical protein
VLVGFLAGVAQAPDCKPLVEYCGKVGHPAVKSKETVEKAGREPGPRVTGGKGGIRVWLFIDNGDEMKP